MKCDHCYYGFMLINYSIAVRDRYLKYYYILLWFILYVTDTEKRIIVNWEFYVDIDSLKLIGLRYGV